MKFDIKDFERHSHDFGELGKFIKLEYLINILNEKQEEWLNKNVLMHMPRFTQNDFRRLKDWLKTEPTDLDLANLCNLIIEKWGRDLFCRE